MKNVEDCKGCKGSKGTFSNIYIYVYFYTHTKLAKVIESIFNTFNTFNAPLSQLLLTGVRKKFEKSCLKIWRGGWGQSCIFAARTSYGSEEGGDIIGCVNDYALMQIARAADGGSSDSGGSM